MQNTETNQTRSEALLVEAEKEHQQKGRLKIFLGAAPGVGKTYAMLQAAQQRRAEGYDILVGLVESHGRKETEVLLKDLKIQPRKKIIYRDKKFGEVDVPGIIKKKPQLVLIDELAHTNIPGSYHDKRYLDVLEILDAGIDVYTTMNIQHIESLNDDIQQITHIKVQETVPDSVFENADAIVIVDLTPEELIQRLKEGKVYVPHMAERAIKHFFSTSNLTALRELALRMAAKNIGQSIFTYKQAHDIEVPWSVAERIIVCISDNQVIPRVIRSAKHMALRKDAKLIALHIETTTEENLSAERKKRLADHLRLAEKMGAELVVLTSHNIANAVLDYARKNNVTDIFMGKSVRPKIFDILLGSVTNEVIRHSGKITTHVLSEKPTEQQIFPTRIKAPVPKNRLSDYIASLILIGLTCLITMLYTEYFSPASSSMLFLLAIMFSAYKWGLYPALFTAVITFIIYIYAYTNPVFVFQVAKFQEGLASVVFIIIAIVISQLTARVRQQAKKARERELMTKSLFNFSKQLGKALNLDELYQTIAREISQALDIQVILFSTDDSRLKLKANFPPRIKKLDKKSIAAAKWSWLHQQSCGCGTETLSAIEWHYLPLKIATKTFAIIAVKPGTDFFSPVIQDFFNSLVDQAAFAIAHMLLLKKVK